MSRNFRLGPTAPGLARTRMRAVWTVALFCGCRRHQAAATIVPVPIGLDSAAVARWVDQQRAACRGRLIMLMDEGGAARNFDTVVTRGTAAPRPEFRYYAGLVEVQCQR